MNQRTDDLRAHDIRSVLHQYTNLAQHPSVGPLVMEGGDGIFVIDSDGNRYIEAMSGLWNAALGFSERRLADAAARQYAKLPTYHDFSHKSNAPMIELAARLLELAPVPMARVYFANSGSEAMDTVVKLLWYRSNALGEPRRKKIISRKRAYHGSTIGAASLTGLANNHRSFDLPLPQILHTECPHYAREHRDAENEAAFTDRIVRELDALIQREGADTIAAFIGEPVMGAGGVIVPPSGYWPAIQAVLQRYGILFVADEVICGIGRTGRMFGSETYALAPDIMVLSKQLTGGYAPLSAVLVNERVFGPVAEESGRVGVWGHGFTTGGHPVSAAVAIETLQIVQSEHLIARAADLGVHMQQRLREFAGHPLVVEARGVGLIGALELLPTADPKSAFTGSGTIGKEAIRRLQQAGVIARNLQDAIAFCPPLIISRAQLDDLFGRVRRVLDDLQRDRS